MGGIGIGRDGWWRLMIGDVVATDAVKADSSEDGEISCLDSDCAKLCVRVCRDTGTEISQQWKVGRSPVLE